tara:strand:+ start:2004 stop:2477 length:474 start_codon:yes stop_codon:yes gene_type:complete
MKIKKKYYTWSDVEKMCVSIVNQMYADNWKPDYIVGITRGGNVPATIISNMTGIKCRALDVSFRDGGEVISDNGMKADAHAGKKILIVDDINDTGATFQWISNDWNLNNIDNVKFATLTNNLASEFDAQGYHCDEVNKSEEDVWLVYPWENVGSYDD